MQRDDPRDPGPEQGRDELRSDLAVIDRVPPGEGVAEIMDETRDLEFFVIWRDLGQFVRALETVVEDVDRIAVGTERVEHARAPREVRQQLVRGLQRFDPFHARHGTGAGGYRGAVTDAPTLTLHEIADRVWVWLQPGGESGVSNAGVVGDEDGLTVIDTLMVRSQWEPFAAAVHELGQPVKRVVLTHAHIDHVGGTGAFRNAMVIGSPMTSALLDQEMPVDAYKAFMPAFTEGFDELAAAGTRPVSHTVEDAAALTPRVEILPARGHTDGDLMALVADADVLFAGDLCFFGVTPLAFQGDPVAWADVLDVVGELAETIVPGHGPIGGATEITELAAYLRHCAAGSVPPGPWDSWLERAERDPINVERAAMLRAGEDGMPPSMLRAIGLA